MSVQPGWHVDPADPTTRRWWDGEGWIGAPIPVDATPPDGPPPPEPEPAAEPPAPTSPAAGSPTTAGRPPGAAAGTAGQPWAGQPSGQPGAGQPWAGQPGAGQPWTGQPGAGQPWTGQPGYPGHGVGQPGGPPPGWPYPTWPGRPPEPRPHGVPLAGYGARLLARLVDFGVVLLLNAVVNGWFVWRYFEETAPYLREALRRAMAGDSSREGLPAIGEQAGGLQIAILVIATALWFAYEVPTTAAGGQTLGKRLLRIRAVPVDADQPLGFGRATRRWSTMGMPTLLWFCCGFGLLLQFVDAVSALFDHPLRQALHDKRAQTVVVRVPRSDHADTPTDPEPPGDTA
ncbi:RDD family protein [Micromonospora rifamycinica]|uniref:RDD family protein n=2 Tax=Micromonospora rifamycinica TaxID=291594 RepID=UPI000B5AF051|nr:RDD family protein [Micromonospora rifamycinica]